MVEKLIYENLVISAYSLSYCRPLFLPCISKLVPQSDFSVDNVTGPTLASIPALGFPSVIFVYVVTFWFDTPVEADTVVVIVFDAFTTPKSTLCLLTVVSTSIPLFGNIFEAILHSGIDLAKVPSGSQLFTGLFWQ